MVRTAWSSVFRSTLALGVLAWAAPAAAQPGAPPPAAPVYAPPPPPPAAPVYAPPPPPPAAPVYAPPPSPPVYAPPPPPPIYVPMSPAAAVAAPVPAAPPEFPRWGLGVHLGGVGITSDRADEDDESAQTDLGLAGVQLRFRLHRRWELELDLTHMQGELPGAGDTMRTTGAVALGGMFHINPDSRWLWSLLAGVGGARDRIWYEKNGDRVTQAEFAEAFVRLGVGLERRFDRWGLGAQLYGLGLERDDEELDGPAFEGRDGPVPERSSGALLQFAANFYF